MGIGSSVYRHERQPAWKLALQTIEVLLYLVFVADCFVLLAGAAGSYYPPGGFSLIVLLLIISLMHRLRCGRDYS